MFTYINENFLHAPSSDLSRETVKSLINIMLAQAQEIFLEKQVADKKKVGLLGKLAAQAGYLYGQALEGVQENVTTGIFDKAWLTFVQVCKQAGRCRRVRCHWVELTRTRSKPIYSTPSHSTTNL